MLIGPGLHAPTLLLSISMFGFLMAGIALGDSSALPAQRRALRLWGRSMLAIGVACLLFYLRGYLPWWMTFTLANAVFMGMPLFSQTAHAELLQQALPRRLTGAACALGVACLAANLALGVSSSVAVFGLSVAFAVLQGTVCWMLWRDFIARRLKVSLAGALVGGPIALAFAYRAVRVLHGDATALAPSDASNLQIGVLMIGMVHVVGTSIAFFSRVNVSQREALIEAFRRDGLTGVYSRPAFFEFATQRLQQHPTLSHAVVMVDLDRFKQINDTHGHAAGDAALVHAARAMSLALRSADLLGRYGGEEFCLLMSDCDEATALQLAERIVQGARTQRVRLPSGQSIAYTVSAGCATVSCEPQQDPEGCLREAIERADAAMYRAKAHGRDRVHCAVARNAVQGGPSA